MIVTGCLLLIKIMATALQVQIVRLNINDEAAEDFTFQEIAYFIDLKNSVNYASMKLIEILIVRLRKEIIKRDTTGVESTEFVSLKERVELLESLAAKYKKDYDNESGTGTGRFISSTRPSIAGGDV